MISPNHSQVTPTSESSDLWQRRRAAMVLFLIGLALLAVGGRLVHLNTSLSECFVDLARRQQRSVSTLPARRGTILDRRGRVVAISKQTSDVFVDPSLVANIEDISSGLAARTNQPVQTIVAKITAKKDARFVIIASDVDELSAQAVRAMNERSVGLVERDKRIFPLGQSMAHALGWVGRDGKGMEGVESGLDHHLRGKDGRRAAIRDVRRRAMRRDESTTRPPVDGGHVVLTLDAEIQRLTEEALAQGVAEYEAESGVAIVMSPRDGDILAMACWPSFDPNEPVTAESLPIRRNRVFTDPVEPGSTFKPFIGCGALDGGFVLPADEIDCRMGVHYFGSRRVVDTKPQGMLNLRGIITKSSNIGMAFVGQRMGNEALRETLRRFGFGERTGVGGRAESAGVVYPLRKWDRYSTTSIPFGYEVLVTPLQLARAFASILNDGILVQPRLVKRLIHTDGSTQEWAGQPQEVRRATSSASARFMAEDALVAVVAEGSASMNKLRNGPYRVLGKTGTAKLINAEQGVYEEGSYLSLFMGAAPVADPQILALVMIRRPNADIGYFGSTVAAPVVGTILANILGYLEVPPDDGSVLAGL